MDFSTEAVDLQDSINASNKDQLAAEAITLAKRDRLESVSKTHVERAATNLRLRTGPEVGDVLLTVGTALSGIAAGVALSLASSDSKTAWLIAAAVVAGVLGSSMTGAGIALKLKSR